MLSNLVAIQQSFYAMIIPTDEVFSIRLGFLRGHYSSYGLWWSWDHPLIWTKQISDKNMVKSWIQTDSDSVNWAQFRTKHIRLSPLKAFEEASGLFLSINWEIWSEKKTCSGGSLRGITFMQGVLGLCPSSGWFLEWPLINNHLELICAM